MRQQLEILAKGRVQGVGFRSFVQFHALRLGLAGYCQNQPDDSVLIVAQGTNEKLKKLLKTVSKGTGWIRVEQVQARWSDELDSLAGFEIRR